MTNETQVERVYRILERAKEAPRILMGKIAETRETIDNLDIMREAGLNIKGLIISDELDRYKKWLAEFEQDQRLLPKVIQSAEGYLESHSVSY